MSTATLTLRSQLRAWLARGRASRLVSGFVLVAILTVFGKGISFIKDAVVARWFGTSDAMDAFVLAFGFLGFSASVLGGGLPEAFLPHYAELKHRRGQHRAQRLAVQAVLGQALTLIVFAALLWFGGASVIELTARGFSPEKRVLAADLLRRLLPFLVCYGMSFQLAIWLRADKFFALAAAAPMIIPITVLVAMLGGATIDSLVAGTVWGSGLQLLVLSVVLSRQLPSQPGWYRKTLHLWEPALAKSFRDAMPYLLAGVVYSSAAVVDQAMAAALLPAGAVSVLSYSDKLVGILLALTAMPAGEVLFPYFADTVARKDWAGLKAQLKRAVLLVGGFSIPATLGLFVLAPQVVGLLFERGAFTSEDTARVAAVMRIAIFQVPFYILGTLCSRVVVSLQATRFILVMSVFSMLANAGLNWVLMQSLGAPGIALSTVCVALLSSIVVLVYVLAQIRRKERQA
jgi:putative peptidoglycan lipid II flippase